MSVQRQRKEGKDGWILGTIEKLGHLLEAFQGR